MDRSSPVEYVFVPRTAAKTRGADPGLWEGSKMLIEFRVTNFRSFREEQTLNLVAGSDPSHPQNLMESGNVRLVKAAGLYGANASGKSNLIKAIGCVCSCVSRPTPKPKDLIRGIDPFRLDVKSRHQPSTFEVVYTIDDIRFEYGFSATTSQVCDEWLKAYPARASRGQTWLERQSRPGSEKVEWSFGKGRFRKSERELLRRTTGANMLALSRAAELNSDALTQAFLWFREGIRVVDLSETRARLAEILMKHRMKADPSFHRLVEQMVKHADFGIEGLTVGETPWERMPLSPGPAAEHHLEVLTTHRVDGSSDHESFQMEDESGGTQRFFALAGAVLDALDSGKALFVDELDCSMHPLLSRKVVEFFQSPAVNTKNAQLIFTTHDTTLLDPELFRRDQIWLVEKNQTGASELFSLYDFKTEERPRHTSAFQRQYLAGRFGAVPNFGPTFEDLELQPSTGKAK